MRTIFITGFGEDEFIFDRIRERLPGEHLVLSLWKELPERPGPGINVKDFAEGLIARYHISPADLVIGHSAGGWVALFIKQAAGCTIIQLASWTDLGKIITPTHNRFLIYFAANTGLYLNRFFLRRSLRKFYEGKPSSDLFKKIFLRLMTGNRANAVNQLRLIFNPVPPATVSPDLRIHARGDHVVRFPDGPVTEVPGDHFSVSTYPEEVVAAILNFLEKIDKNGVR